MSTQKMTAKSGMRWIVVSGLAIAVFVGAYAYASTKNSAVNPSGSVAVSGTAVAGTGTAVAGTASGGSPTPACACCGSAAPTKDGVTGNAVPGAAQSDGSVQKISVDLSKGYYDPNVVTLKAGLPAEITFGQSSGCTGQVMSQQLGFFEDLTAGPRTVKLPALEKGTYSFSCGMQMVFGKIVVE